MKSRTYFLIYFIMLFFFGCASWSSFTYHNTKNYSFEFRYKTKGTHFIQNKMISPPIGYEFLFFELKISNLGQKKVDIPYDHILLVVEIPDNGEKELTPVIADGGAFNWECIWLDPLGFPTEPAESLYGSIILSWKKNTEKMKFGYTISPLDIFKAIRIGDTLLEFADREMITE